MLVDMVAGLFAFDLLYVALSTALYGLAAHAGFLLAGRLPDGLPLAVRIAAGVLVALVALAAEVALLVAVLPRLQPGRHPFLRGRVFWSWALRFVLRRILHFPALKAVYFGSNVLRWLSLRALGARVAFASNMSNDVDVLDPSLLTIDTGATIGARALLSGHYVQDGMLVLGEIRVGAGALVSVGVTIGPDVTIGPRATVKGLSALTRDIVIGDGADIGGETAIEPHVRIGAGAKTAPRAHVPPRTVIADGESWPPAGKN